MDSSVSPKDEIWFLRVCHHISNAVYKETQHAVGGFVYLRNKKRDFYQIKFKGLSELITSPPLTAATNRSSPPPHLISTPV